MQCFKDLLKLGLDEVDYLTLINQGKFEEAANELYKKLELDPDDTKRSLLAVCLWFLGKTENALQFATQIEHPTHFDYKLLADIHWQLKNWNEMVFALKLALRISPSAEIYYRLAIAEGKERYLYEIDAASKEIMRGYLTKATDFEDCPVDVFLFLVRLYEREEVDSKLDTLFQALERYPDNADVRLELASVLIYWKGKYERAIKLVTPLLDTDERNGVARWYAFVATLYQKKYLEATEYLECIRIEEANELARIKADILFRQGKLREWLIYSDECADDASSEAGIRKYFRKAYVNLLKNNLKQAVDDFTQGANLLLESNEIPYSEIYIRINKEIFPYTEFDVIIDVCETLLLLESETKLLTSHSLGLLAYTIYSCCSQAQQQELITFFPEHSDSLLLLSAKLLNFPPSLGEHLACKFLNEDLPKAIHHYLAYSIWRHHSDSYFVQNISNQFYGDKKQLNETALQQIPLINEVVLNHMRVCKASEAFIEVFLPFYNNFWRSILFETKAFNIIAEVSKQFVEASHGNEGLFDYAYSLNALGNQDEAQAAYIKLIIQEPNNASAINNLGVIYERNAMLAEAFDLYNLAAKLRPTEQLYSSNRDKLKKSLDFRNQSLQKVQEAHKIIKRKAYDFGLDDEQLTELNLLYWESDSTIKVIQERLNLQKYSSNRLLNFIIPKSTDEKCPNCLIELIYKNRSERKADEKICLGCGHQSRSWCRCAYCQKLEEQRRSQAEDARRQAAIEEFKKLQEQYCKQDYVEWAVTKLSRKEKIFLKSFIEVVQQSDEPTWEEIRERAGVVSEKTYLEKLKKLKLLLVNLNQNLIINSALQLSMLEVETVRKISSSLRFDVFQRDNHTCQYCGRTPPDVKLVIDHLIPVAQGGTDIFENLVTSCEECNSGKSDKLIQQFTGGYSKQEWSEQIRSKRTSILRERRERLDKIKQHWMESLGRRSLSERDNQAIYSFVECYEPDWIKAAIGIAARKGIERYINYTGAILRNWAKEGPPEYLSNPNAGLAKKPATPKQISYVASLLERAGLSLNEVCDKTDFDRLTMLDARNLILALTEEVDE